MTFFRSRSPLLAAIRAIHAIASGLARTIQCSAGSYISTAETDNDGIHSKLMPHRNSQLDRAHPYRGGSVKRTKLINLEHCALK